MIGEPSNAIASHAAEVGAGERFRFGANWSRFLAVLDEERVREAERSLVRFLGQGSLAGRSFLDVGSGSGLFSLAARRLGARVLSFDYDPDSVACTRELRRRFFPGDPGWDVRAGSVLDERFLAELGRHDVVYSWGVLHHTGDMWRAIDHAAALVAPGGRFFLALYNDQGARSAVWKRVKRFYCSGRLPRALVLGAFVPLFVGGGLAKDLLAARNPLRRYSEYKRSRGMSRVHDWVDWLGGYPFEVARPAALVRFLRERGFVLDVLQEVGGGAGNNQFVFRRAEPCPDP